VNLSSPARSTVTVKIALPLLLLLLLMTQAASTVCGAQCVQHQLPSPSTHAMADCHSMQQSEPNGPVLQTCPSGTQAICALDLLGNTQGKTTPQLTLHAAVRSAALLPGENIPQLPSASRPPRSSTDSSPLITALRV
jgi:hypothetical protein